MTEPATPALSAMEAAGIKMPPGKFGLVRVAKKRKTPPEVLRELSTHNEQQVRSAVAFNISTPADTLYEMSRSDDHFIRERVAQNTAAPLDLLLGMLEGNQELATKLVLAQRNPIHPELAEKLGESIEWRVMTQLAMNRSTPKDLLVAISRTHITNVAAALVHNPNTPGEALERVMLSGSSSVKAHLAHHNHVTPKMLEALSMDESEDVRLAVVQNKLTPMWVVASLVRTEDSYDIRDAATRRLKVLDQR